MGLTDPREVIRQLQCGCRNIFIDLGANVGIHSRFLFEPHRYPRERHPKTGRDLHPYADIFDREFGRSRNLSATCAVAFEPNPGHSARHRELHAAYLNAGWRHLHVAAGVSDRNGSLTFYANGDYAKTGQKNYLSFAATRLATRNTPPMVLPTIDFAWFLGLFRQLRPAPHVLTTAPPSTTRARVAVVLPTGR